MLDFVLQCLYFLAPAGFAIFFPDIFGHFNWIPKLNIPVDFHKTFRGKRITGDHKTIRGFVVGVIGAVVIGYIQYLLQKYNLFQSHSLVDYSSLNISLMLSFLMGLGALVGDSVKSFFKRQFNVAPGESFFFFDQVDFIIGAYIFALPIIVLPFRYFVGMLIIYFLIHVSSTGVGYLIGIKRNWIK